MKESEQVLSLPSTEDTKLGSILKYLSPELQEVKDSILHISHRYRQDLTTQLDQSFKFEQHLEKNNKRLAKKSKRLYQKAESLNTSLNKRLDQLKPYDELNDISQGITDSIFGILDSLNQIEMILPYNERLGVKDSPHRAHYPYLYQLMNPVEDESTIKEDDDELSGFEQLSVHELQDLEQNDVNLSSDDHGVLEETQEPAEQTTIESEGDKLDNVVESTKLQSIGPEKPPNDEESDSLEQKVELEEYSPGFIQETEYQSADSEGEVIGTSDNDTQELSIQSKDQGAQDSEIPESDTPEVTNGATAGKQGKQEIPKDQATTTNNHVSSIPLQKDSDSVKELELESVIDSYKTTKSIRQAQSIRSFRPISSAISIPSPTSTAISMGTTTSSGASLATGTLLQRNGSGSLADNLKKIIKKNGSGSDVPAKE